jgi:hypothetical protein
MGHAAIYQPSCVIPDADSEHEAGETNGDSQSSDGTSSISEEVIPVEDRSASQDQSSVQEEPPDEEGASASSEDENQPVEHSKNEKLNYLQTVKIDSSRYSPHLENGVPSFHVEVCEDSNIFKIVLPASDCNPSSSVDSEREVMHLEVSKNKICSYNYFNNFFI